MVAEQPAIASDAVAAFEQPKTRPTEDHVAREHDGALDGIARKVCANPRHGVVAEQFEAEDPEQGRDDQPGRHVAPEPLPDADRVAITISSRRDKASAFRFAVNVVMYAFCLDYKTEQAHIDFILRTRRQRF